MSTPRFYRLRNAAQLAERQTDRHREAEQDEMVRLWAPVAAMFWKLADEEEAGRGAVQETQPTAQPAPP